MRQLCYWRHFLTKDTAVPLSSCDRASSYSTSNESDRGYLKLALVLLSLPNACYEYQSPALPRHMMLYRGSNGSLAATRYPLIIFRLPPLHSDSHLKT